MTQRAPESTVRHQHGHDTTTHPLPTQPSLPCNPDVASRRLPPPSFTAPAAPRIAATHTNPQVFQPYHLPPAPSSSSPTYTPQSPNTYVSQGIYRPTDPTPPQVIPLLHQPTDVAAILAAQQESCAPVQPGEQWLGHYGDEQPMKHDDWKRPWREALGVEEEEEEEEGGVDQAVQAVHRRVRHLRLN